jgi:tetratricopeptide (TPR) repeat protein
MVLKNVMTRKAILLLFAVLILLPLSRVVGQTKSITEHLQSANTLMQEGKFDEATNEYDQVLKVAPNNPGALSGRAWAKFLRKDLDGAITDSDKLVKLYPKASGIEKIHNLRGIIFTILLNSEAAFREFSKSIEINPNFLSENNIKKHALITIKP